jgi:ABC-type glycerol-3-phosphate transport system substrate-binding protein
MIRRCFYLLTVLILTLGYISLRAQDKIILTVAIPQWFGDAYDSEYFDLFRQQNPGVDVVIVSDSEGRMYPTPPAYASVDDHLKATFDYVSMADVLYITSYTMTPENTAAGLWLDLAPLVAAEPSLDESMFYPAAWRSFRWNRGMWALPVTVEPQILTYDPAAFDAAGLSYPSASWTIDDYVNAALTLTVRDANGKPVTPGCWCNSTIMFYGLMGHGLTDVDGMPMLENPQLAEMVEKWGSIQDQIYPADGYSSQGVSLQMLSPWTLSSNVPGSEPLVPGELPGGVYGAQANGFAVSAGTAAPELAFSLVKYMVENPVNGFASFGTFAALRDVDPVIPSGYMVESIDDLPPEQQQVLRDAVENAAVGADLHYFDYVNQAMNQMLTEEMDALSALQMAQQKILENRELAASWSAPQVLMIATVAPTPSFGADEIALNFGFGLWNNPNQTDWDRLAREFAEADSGVGVVNINRQGSSYEEWQTTNDCFYLPYDPISPFFNAEYLSLDPFTDADPTFNASDFVPGALEALQLEGTTYGYPLSIEVSALRYDPSQFEAANIPPPQWNWTVAEFTDALNQLARMDDAAFSVPFAPRSAEVTDWLLLMAAHGALPVDYRTDPPTYNFTDPSVVDAVRQVLDMAREGLIDYQELGTFYFSGVQKNGALTAVSLTGGDNFMVSSTSAFVNYPQGTTYKVGSLGSVGGGYIRPDTPHREACYRWISFISAHPELLSLVMPARLSAIDDPVTVATQGENAVALYRQYADMAADPSVINISSSSVSSFESYFLLQFLVRAFDAYVLEDADLEPVLADAQTKVDEFLTCNANIPPVNADSSTEEMQTNADAIEDCIAQVDPEMAAERQEILSSFE